MTKGRERKRVLPIQFYRSCGQLDGRDGILARVARPALTDIQAVPPRRPRNGHGEVLIFGNCFFQKFARPQEGFFVQAIDDLYRSERVVVSGETFRPFSHRITQLGFAHVGRNAGNNLLNNLVLKIKQLAGRDLHRVAPHGFAGLGVACLD